MLSKYLRWTDQVEYTDRLGIGSLAVDHYGALGKLRTHGIPAPDGFLITRDAFMCFMEANELLTAVAGEDRFLWHVWAAQAPHRVVMTSPFPTDLADAILAAYRSLSSGYDKEQAEVSVRAWAVFPHRVGEKELTYFAHISNADDLLDSLRRCYAALFSRGISEPDLPEAAVVVAVTKSVRADRACSGFAWSIDPESRIRNVVAVKADWGLPAAEKSDSDTYLVYKPFLNRERLKPIIEKKLGEKTQKTVYRDVEGTAVAEIETADIQRHSFVLSDKDIMTLAEWTSIAEKLLGKPVRLQWARDGKQGSLYVLGVASAYPSVTSDPETPGEPDSHIPQKAPRTSVLVEVGDTRPASTPLPGHGAFVRLDSLVRREIGIHPVALLRTHQLRDRETKESIRRITRGYPTKTTFFVDKLARGLGRIAASEYPKSVVALLSDPRIADFGKLIGGREIEDLEKRLPAPSAAGAHHDGFALECMAIRKVREEMGFRNVIAAVPFCRTVREADRLLEEMASYGLHRHQNALQVYLVSEVPSNILLVDQFAERFSGFLIDGDRLKSHLLGMDAEASASGSYDNENDALKRAIAETISIAHLRDRAVGIYGGVLEYATMVEFVCEAGIDFLAASRDEWDRMAERIAEIDAELDRRITLETV